jgi:hypothetical protein
MTMGEMSFKTKHRMVCSQDQLPSFKFELEKSEGAIA